MDIPSGAERPEDESRPGDAPTEGRSAPGADRPESDDPAPTDGPEDPDTEDDDGSPDPLRFHRWMRTSSAGGVLTGIALGLQHALEEHRQQPAFVMEAPGEPEDPDAPIVLHFDPDDPTRTVAVIRRASGGGPASVTPDDATVDGEPTGG